MSLGCHHSVCFRHSLSLRRKTIISQRLPSDLDRPQSHCIHHPLIGNMDETLLWLDMPRETTVTHTNDRSVPSWTELGVITVAYSKNGWMNENLTKDSLAGYSEGAGLPAIVTLRIQYEMWLTSRQCQMLLLFLVD